MEQNQDDGRQALPDEIRKNLAPGSVFTIAPKGIIIREHPAGGWIIANPDHPPRWLRTDGTIEEMNP